MQDEWALKEAERRERRNRRDREKTRRRRALMALREKAPPPEPLDNREYELVTTRSGLLAVIPKEVRRGVYGEALSPISLPYVPFIHGRTLREAR